MSAVTQAALSLHARRVGPSPSPGPRGVLPDALPVGGDNARGSNAGRGNAAGNGVSNGYPLTWFVTGQNRARLVFRL